MLWDAINWKGNFLKQVTERPPIEELSTYFEDLYKSVDCNERLN